MKMEETALTNISSTFYHGMKPCFAQDAFFNEDNRRKKSSPLWLPPKQGKQA
jgi:hypothetical protein